MDADRNILKVDEFPEEVRGERNPKFSEEQTGTTAEMMRYY